MHLLYITTVRASYDGERFKTREQLSRTVFEYIEVDYNRNRRRSAIGFISPMAFEAKHA